MTAKTAALASAILLTTGTAGAFDLTSANFDAGGLIPPVHSFDGFGCTGDNLSPALAWSSAPEGTRSFALMVHDPDAPTGGAGFWHWAVLDIPADAAGLPQGAGTADGAVLPDGARQLRNDFGVPGWGGPCPPEGAPPHRYDFTLYALPVDRLELPDGATTSLAGFLITTGTLGTATLQGRFINPATRALPPLRPAGVGPGGRGNAVERVDASD